MATYKGLNFGPILGSVVSNRRPPSLGRLIRIKKYNGGGTNPLQGGYWTTEFIDTGGPDGGYIGSIPIDYPPDDGGGGGGGKEDDDPDLECPHWAKIYSPSGDSDICTDEEKKKITASYERIAYSLPWVKELEPIGAGTSDWLLGCIRSKFCAIDINCTSGVTEIDAVYESEVVPRPRLNVSIVSINSSKKWYFDHDLLSRLILACGGTALDAFAISEITPSDEFSQNGGKYFSWTEIQGDRTSLDWREVLDNSRYRHQFIDGRRIVVGKWVWWERKTGKIGLIPSLDFVLDIDKGHWKF